MDEHLKHLAAAQKLVKDNPELHDEFKRRRAAGEWFRPGEPVTIYMKNLLDLNKKAAEEAGF